MTDVNAMGPDREEQPFISYADRSAASNDVEAILTATEERMGFVPNSFRLYLHSPHIFRQVNRLNNTVMRHAANVLPEDFKYRLGLLISRNHGCRYCCSHEAHAMKRKWGLDDQRLDEILHLENPHDEREGVAWEFVHAASQGPQHVTDDLRRRLAMHFSPEERVEIACTLGFWAFFNRVHSSLGVPIESHLLDEAHWVDTSATRPEEDD